MPAVVIDTNVAIVANGLNTHASGACVKNCIEVLREVVAGIIVVMDESGLIFQEYRRHLSPSGQHGTGDFFLKWLWDHQCNPRHCELVSITPINGGSFVEFPSDPDLARFDRSDRKFVAVALSSQLRPEILNAVDTDWLNSITALRRNGIKVRFLCPTQQSGKPVRQHGTKAKRGVQSGDRGVNH